VIKNVGIVQSRNTLGLGANKIFNALLYVAYPTLESQHEYSITVKKLTEYMCWDDNATSSLKEALRSICNTAIEFDIINGKKNVWEICPLMENARIEDGICTFSFNPKIRLLLAAPEIYVRLKFRLMNRLSSKISLVLYENTYRYHKLGLTKWFDIQKEFKSLFGLKANQYKDRRDWQKYLIKLPIKEINEKTDIHLTPEFKKEGRKYKWVRFRIKENPRTSEGLELLGQENLLDLLEEKQIFLERLEEQGVICNSTVNDLVQKLDVSTLFGILDECLKAIKEQNTHIPHGYAGVEEYRCDKPQAEWGIKKPPAYIVSELKKASR
jgi:plasmid replication initiation protein